MTKYAQIVGNKVHGIFEYDPLPEFAPNIQMVNIDNVLPQPKAGWLYDGTTFSEPQPEPTPDLGSKITRLAMRNRFTADEKRAIYTAADADVDIRIYLDDLNSATFIDLARQDTIDNVNLLEQGGILATGRADEIINSPVQPNEVYNKE